MDKIGFKLESLKISPSTLITQCQQDEVEIILEGESPETDVLIYPLHFHLVLFLFKYLMPKSRSLAKISFPESNAVPEDNLRGTQMPWHPSLPTSHTSITSAKSTTHPIISFHLNDTIMTLQ